MARDVVVIGASAGGLEAVRELASRLAPDFPASVFVVIHTAPEDRTSGVAEILGRAGPLAVSTPRDGDVMRAGRIYVAQPNRHLAVEQDRIRITKGPLQNGRR